MADHSNLDDVIPPVQECNILIIGKIGVGKSTLVEIIKDPKYHAKRKLSIAPPSDAQYHCLALVNEHTNTKVALNIIETPGLLYSGGDDNAILQQCWKLLEKSIRHLNAVILMYRYDAIIEEDISLIQICDNFFRSHFNANTVVVFTFAEKYDHQYLKKQLVNIYEPVKDKLNKFCQGRILFTGALNEDEIKKMSPNAIEQIRSNVESMRHMFFENILTLPPSPLPEEITFLFDSRIEDIMKNLISGYGKDEQAQMFENLRLQMFDKQRKSKVAASNQFYKKLSNANAVSWKTETDDQPWKRPLPNQSYTAYPAVRRNVLLVGASGAGKTTFIKIMQDPTYEVRQSISFAATQFTKFFPVLLMEQDRNYVIVNFIDTPGFGDLKKGNVKNNEESRKQARLDILGSIQMCFTESVTEIHSLFYMHQHDRPWTRYDDEYFTQYRKEFEEIFSKCGWFLFTRCEEGQQADLQQKQLVFFSAHPNVKDGIGSRLAFTGANDSDSMSNYNAEYREECKVSIVNFRNKLLNIIYESIQPVSLPSFIRDLSNDIQNSAVNLKTKMEKTRKIKKQQELEKLLFPKKGDIVNLVTGDNKYVCLDKKNYLAFGTKATACNFNVNVLENNDIISLSHKGKYVHRTMFGGWVDLDTKPIPLQIIPLDQPPYFTLYCAHDKSYVGYTYDNKYLQIDKDRKTAIFLWEFVKT